VTGILGAFHDEVYTTSKHTRSGKQVLKDLAKGKSAHVFDDGVDLKALEEKVWREGTYQGQVRNGHRAMYDRFVWRSPMPIGRRIQTGRSEFPLYWVEIKGKIDQNMWVYHLAPRTRPAS
jgi:hypothetical protein